MYHIALHIAYSKVIIVLLVVILIIANIITYYTKDKVFSVFIDYFMFISQQPYNLLTVTLLISDRVGIGT